MATTDPPHAVVQRLVRPSNDQGVAPSYVATAAIRDLAERQHGVVAWRQLVALGLGKDLIHDRVRTGRLVPLHRGVFAVGHRRISRHGEWLAGVLACGPGAVLSYGSAAQLWGIWGSRGPVEVTRISGHRRPHGVRLHQTRWLPLEHVTVKAGIPVTTLERTALDLAERLDTRQMEHLLVAADRSHGLRWTELQRLLEQANGRKGRGRLKRVMLQVNPSAADTRSPPEIDFLAVCREAGLPLPQVNVFVEGHLADFYWPKARVVVETDGYAFHKDRLAFERDRRATIALMAAGYKVIRATARMVENDPDPLLELLRQSVGT